MRGSRLLPFSLTAILVLITACQRSTGGPLEPMPSAGIKVGQDRSAILRNGDIVARVTARWSSTGENSLRINYRNAGQVRRTVAIDGLKMTHSTGEAALLAQLGHTSGFSRRTRKATGGLKPCRCFTRAAARQKRSVSGCRWMKGGGLSSPHWVVRVDS